MSRRRLAKLLNDVTQKDEQRRATEEAIEQENFKSKPIPITQDEELMELPEQPEPDIPAKPVRRSIRIQDQLSGDMFCRPPTAANISRNTLYKVLGDAMFDTSAHSNVPDSLMESKLNMSPAIDLEAMKKENLEPELDLEELCNGVVHPVTNETITKYQKLIDDPLLRDE